MRSGGSGGGLQLGAESFDNAAVERVEHEQQRCVGREQGDRVAGEHLTARLVPEPPGRGRGEIGIELDAHNVVSRVGTQPGGEHSTPATADVDEDVALTGPAREHSPEHLMIRVGRPGSEARHPAHHVAMAEVDRDVATGAGATDQDLTHTVEDIPSRHQDNPWSSCRDRSRSLTVWFVNIIRQTVVVDGRRGGRGDCTSVGARRGGALALRPWRPTCSLRSPRSVRERGLGCGHPQQGEARKHRNRDGDERPWHPSRDIDSRPEPAITTPMANRHEAVARPITGPRCRITM